MKQMLFGRLTLCAAMCAAAGLAYASGAGPDLIAGRVEGCGGPIAKATVIMPLASQPTTTRGHRRSSRPHEDVGEVNGVPR